MLETILQKESVNEQDIKILNENIHLLSDADKLRFGFITKEEAEDYPGYEDIVEIVEAPKKRKKAAKRVPLN